MIIVDRNGRVYTGNVGEERDDLVKLITPQGGIIAVPADNVDERVKDHCGMPAGLTRGLRRG